MESAYLVKKQNRQKSNNNNSSSLDSLSIWLQKNKET